MRRKRKSKNSGLLMHWPIIVLGAAAIALVSAIAYVGFHTVPPKPETNIAEVPVYYKRAEEAVPFPATLAPESFKPADVQDAYQTAKEIPEVLAQQPCYCYCQRKGHRSLLDCFRTDHAVNCDICIKESLLAGQMHRHGKSAQEIRTAIIQGQWANMRSSNQ